MNERYRCSCGWEGSEDELDSKCTFWGTREEPPEYEANCPDCGGDWDDMVEADLCISCEKEFSLYALNLCAACTVDAAEQTLENR